MRPHHARSKGAALPLRGNDIDTDRIIPARFLRASRSRGSSSTSSRTTARLAAPRHNRHPFDDPRYQGASMLLVNANFGCGSSREHAPQATAALGHPGGRRRVVRRDLLRQLGDDRHAVRHGVGRPT